MSLTQEQITRLAKLTALSPKTNLEIDNVVDSFNTTSTISTKNIDNISRSGQQKMILREDVIREEKNLPDKLLKCSPQRTAAHQIVLAGIMHGE